MSETPNDPAGTTHQFQNFAAQGPAEKSSKVNTGLLLGIGGAVVLLIIMAIAVWMIV